MDMDSIRIFQHQKTGSFPGNNFFAFQTNDAQYLRNISVMTWPDLEKAYVNALMEKFNWNITWAAEASGINGSTFASRMRKLNIYRNTGPS